MNNERGDDEDVMLFWDEPLLASTHCRHARNQVALELMPIVSKSLQMILTTMRAREWEVQLTKTPMILGYSPR